MAQRSVIVETQDRLLAGLSHVPSSLKRYEIVPYIALSTDSAGLAQLQSSVDVLDVGPDLVMKLAAGENLTQIGATNAWYWGYTGEGKTIAILDSGVDKTHQELSGKVVAEACYSTKDDTQQYSPVCPGGFPTSTDAGSGLPCTVDGLGDVENCGHGTHVAGIAAGRAGVAKDANIISIQVMTRSDYPGECGFGSCLRALNSDLIFALQHVNEIRGSYDIAAVNVGLVTDLTNSYPNSCDNQDGVGAVKDLIDQLKSVGIAVVAPSGNDGMIDALRYPACISTAISVGAVGDVGGGTAADEVWEGSNSAQFLNLLAPGVGITSAIPGGGHATASGTSQAAAHVSGAMALLRQECPIGANSTVWVDDALPAGAVPYPDDTAAGGVTETWNWVSANPTPYSGTASHQSSIVAATNIRQHFFTGATTTLHVGIGEILYTWVYLDKANMPSEIMLQWYDGVSWEHRAYWGTNTMGWGQDGTPSGMNMGRLPPGDSWVKLVIPARAVALEGKTVNGMAFTQKGGRVTWDQAGKESASVEDLLALFRSTGVSVTDTRITNPPPRIIPRIKIDAALGVTPPDDRWVVAYYNNMNLEGPPAFLGNDGNGFIDHNFSGASPAPGIGTEHYSIRWMRRRAFTQGSYSFSVTGDDGVRLYIDGQLTIPQWVDQGATTYNANVTLSADIHEIKLEYYQNTGPAQVRLIWGAYDPGCEQTTVPAGRWKGEYYNNVNLAGSPPMTLDEGGGFLSFDWGTRAPCPLQGQPCSACNIFADNFSARWKRTVNLLAGTYRFTVSNIDDGVRLYVRGQRIIDRWFDASGASTFDISLPGGDSTIILEYYEGGGSARVNLSWAALPPNSPSNLVASAASDTTINLNWADHSANEDGFKIERWNGSSYAEINTVGPNVLTYIDTGRAALTTYFYRIRAYNSAGFSDYSNESSATTLAPPPPPHQPGTCLGVPDYATYPTTGCVTGLTVVNGVCTRSQAFRNKCDQLGHGYDEQRCVCTN
jgi:subtilisin family serine protease